MNFKQGGLSLESVRQINKGEDSFSSLEQILEILMGAVFMLQNMKEIEENIFFQNMIFKFPKQGIDLRQAKKHYEINLIRQALRQTDGHQSNAAKLLNVSTSTLSSIIRRYDI